MTYPVSVINALWSWAAATSVVGTSGIRGISAQNVGQPIQVTNLQQAAATTQGSHHAQSASGDIGLVIEIPYPAIGKPARHPLNLPCGVQSKRAHCWRVQITGGRWLLCADYNRHIFWGLFEVEREEAVWVRVLRIARRHTWEQKPKTSNFPEPCQSLKIHLGSITPHE
jgi:hypothetical protein